MFVAVPLPAAVRAALVPAVTAVRATPGCDRLRWAEPARWHVTIAFLGDVADPDAVSDRFRGALAGVAPAHVETTGRAGTFGARVLWAELAGDLARIADRIRPALDVEAPPFRAHLTLARAAGRLSPRTLRGVAGRYDGPRMAWTADEVVMYESRLGPGGAHHEPFTVVALGRSGDQSQ